MMLDGLQNTISLSKATKFIVDNRGKTAPTVDRGIPLIATNCIDNNYLYPLYEKVRYVSKETYDNWFRAHPEPGDIILTLKGSQNGAVCLVPSPVNFVIAQDMIALRADEEIIDPLFLFAALRSPDAQEQIKNLDVSGVIPHFKKTDFDKLILPCPNFTLQKSIGRIYFNFCSKIDLLHRQNNTLEAMAETLFRKWFVEEADESWEEGELGNYLDIVYGKNLPTSKLLPNGYPVYGGNGQIGFYDAYLYELPQVLVSCRGEASGTVNISLPKSFVTNNSLILEINMNKYITFEYLKYFSLFTNYKDYVTGSAQPQITIESLRRARFVLPPRYLIDKYSEIVKNIEAKRFKNKKQIQTLENLRNILLPKLMNGEIKVIL